MAIESLNIESMKSLFHHLIHHNPVDEATKNTLHQQVDDLDISPEIRAQREAEAASKVQVPPGWEAVPDAPGTFRPIATPPTG